MTHQFADQVKQTSADWPVKSAARLNVLTGWRTWLPPKYRLGYDDACGLALNLNTLSVMMNLGSLLVPPIMNADLQTFSEMALKSSGEKTMGSVSVSSLPGRQDD
jgi:hypothetical protein